MARRLNKRLLVNLAIFVGVPVVALASLVTYKLVFLKVDPQVYVDSANEKIAKKDFVGAWSDINRARSAGGKSNPEIQYRAGEIALQQSPANVIAAQKAFRIALKLRPGYFEAQRELANLEVQCNLYDDARRDIDALIAIKKDFGEAYLWGARVEMKQAETEPVRNRRTPYYEAALARCEEGIKQSPSTIELYGRLMQIYAFLDQTDKIDTVPDLAIANNPTLAEAYSLKAGWQANRGEIDKAIETFRQGIEKAEDDGVLYLGLAEILVRKGETDQAREYLQKAIQADPTLEAAYFQLSDLQQSARDAEGMLATFQAGLKAIPDSLDLRTAIADFYLNQNAPEKAEAIMTEIAKMSPKDWRLDYLHGKQAIFLKHFREAIALFQEVQKPQLVLPRQHQIQIQARVFLAEAYRAVGETGLAAKELSSLIDEAPRWPLPRKLLAQIQYGLRQYDDAAANCRVVIEVRPDDTETRLLLAAILLSQGRTQEAVREIQKVADQKPDDPVAHLMMAAVFEKDKPAEAEAAILRAIGTGKELAKGYRQLIRLYRRTGQTDKLAKAVEDAKKALPEDVAISVTAANAEELESILKKRVDADPSRIADTLSLARLYQLTDRTDEAISKFSFVLDQVASDSDQWRQAWDQLFSIYLKAGTYDEAAKLIERLKKVSPDATEVGYASALLALNQGQLDEACRLLNEAVQKQPSAQTFFLLGKVLAQQKKYDEAAVQLQKAVELTPNYVLAHLVLGEVYLNSGNNAGAISEASESLKYSPELIAAFELKARAHTGEGAWTAAIEAREQIRSLAPDNIGNLALLAGLYQQQLLFDKAEGVLADAYKRAPDNMQLIQRFADFYAQTGRPEKGRALLDGYIAQHSDQASAYIIRGIFVANLDGPAEAEKDYRRAAELAPEDPSPFLLLGDQFGRARQWDESLKAYGEAATRVKDEKMARGVQLSIADVLVLKGDLDEASKMASEIYKKDPKNARAIVILARILQKQDKEDQAIALLSKAVANIPDSGEAKFRLAAFCFRSDAKKALDLLAGVAPTDAAFERSMKLRAAINAQRGMFDEGIVDLRRLLEYHPENFEARSLLAGFYLAANDPTRAAEVLNGMVASRPKDAAIRVTLGDALFAKKDYSAALEQYVQARAIQPVLPAALVGEAQCLVALNRKEEAIKRVVAVLNERPVGEAWPRLALVTVYELTGEPGKAVEALVEGIRYQSDWEVGYLRLAGILVQHKDLARAREILTEGVKRVPQGLSIRTELAKIELMLGRPQVALDYLDPIVKQYEADLHQEVDDPSQLTSRYAAPLGVYSLALYRLEKIDEAIRWAQIVWKQTPADLANSNNLAWMLATERKALSEATDIVQYCLRLKPDNPQVLDTAGWIAYFQGNYEQARQYLMNSINQGDSAEARYHLGRTFEARKQPDEACQQYQKALQLGGLQPKELEDLKQHLKALGK